MTNSINMANGLHEFQSKMEFNTDDKTSVDEQTTVILNVGGVKYETTEDTLKTLPKTKLSNLDNIKDHYHKDKNEYYFDRSSLVFEYILNFYRIGELHVPANMCSVMVQRELQFWKIDEAEILDCCWLKYNEHKSAQRILLRFMGRKTNEQKACGPDSKVNITKGTTCWQKWQPRIWAVLDDPYTGIASKVSKTNYFNYFYNILA